MARLNHGQRLDLLEQEVAELPTRVAQEITTALVAFKADLNNQLAAGQEKIRSDLRSSLNRSPSTWDNPFSSQSQVGSGERGDPGSQSNWKMRKLDLPLFDGTNPDGWILRAERFFHFYRLGEEDQLEAAIVALEGDALLWYQWERQRHAVPSWDALKKLILRRFRSTATGTLHEQWLAHEQTGTVAEYQRRFIELLAPIDGIPEEIAKGQYIKGLKEEIRIEVRILDPITLDQAMELSMRIEEKWRLGPRPKPVLNIPTWRNPYHNPRANPISPTQIQKLSPSKTTTIPKSHNHHPHTNQNTFNTYKNSGGMRRLSEKELQQKREQGLCFRCDEKWSVNHRCQRRGLSVLLTEEEEEDEMAEDGELAATEVRANETIINHPNSNLTPEVSLSSVMGLTGPKTMRLAGIINEQDVVVMIDPGATHNFISKAAAQQLGLNPTENRSFGVTLGTGETVQGEGVCKGVVLDLQGVTIVEEFLILPLGSSDVILGIQWLEKLGTISTNWKTDTKISVGRYSNHLKR